MTEVWRLLILKEIPPLWTHLIWHASALYASQIGKNTLILNYTDGQLVSCGYFQDILNEINTKYCRKNQILYTKRMTGGGTVLLNRDQVFFNFIFYGYQFPISFELLYKMALKGPLEFYRSLKLNCNLNYNEIEINQKRISSSGIATIEDTSVVVGNIIIDFDYNTFINVLSLPTICFENYLRNNLDKYITSLSREKKILKPR